MFKKILLSPWTALITLALVLFVRMNNPAFVESVRLRYFDTLITSKAPTENNIITINIDESALDKWGQWPFKRDIYANIVEDLYKKNAGLVVWNIMMPEPDRQGGDSILAEIMKKYPLVLSNTPNLKNKNIPRNPGSAVINAKYIDSIIAYPGIIANIPDLENSAVGVGTINTLPEIDGVNRRLPLIVTANGKLYPNLSLETLRVLAGDNTVQIKLSEIGVDKMRIPKFGPITTDPLGRIWIDWSQHTQSYSVTNVPLNLNGAVVIVGTTAAGIANPVPTAKGAVWPQDLQAAVLGTMINKVNIQRPDWADGAEILITFVIGFLLIILVFWRKK